jgi:hypothetical protein
MRKDSHNGSQFRSHCASCMCSHTSACMMMHGRQLPGRQHAAAGLLHVNVAPLLGLQDKAFPHDHRSIGAYKGKSNADIDKEIIW